MKYYLRILLISILFIVSTLEGRANNKAILDSLLQELNKPIANDSIRGDLYKNIGRYYLYVDIQKMKEYGDSTIYIAKKINSKYLECKGYNLKGIAAWTSENPKEGLRWMEKGVDIARDIEDLETIAMFENNIGLIHVQLGRYFKAYKSHQHVYEIAEGDLERFKFSSLFNMGRDLYHNKNYEQALRHLLDLEEILDEGKKGIVKFGPSDYDRYRMLANNLLLNIYIGLNDTLNISIYEDRLKQSYKDEVTFFNSEKLYALGNASMWRKSYDEAQKYYTKSLKFHTQIGYSLGITETIHSLTMLYLETKDWENVIKYGERGIQEAQKGLDLDIEIGLLSALSQAYGALERYDKAIELGVNYRILKDSFIIVSRGNKLDEVNYQSQIKREETEHALLLADKAYKEANLQRNFYGQIAIVSVLLLVFLLGGYYFRGASLYEKKNLALDEIVEQRTNRLANINESLNHKNKELASFSDVISRSFREQLNSISGQVSEVRASHPYFQSEAIGEYFEFVERNIFQMDALISDILTFTQITRNNLEFKPCNTQQIVNSVAGDLDQLIQSKNAKIKTKNLSILVSDYNLLYLLIQNLVENSLKFNTSEEPLVEISMKYVDKQNVLIIKDNGIGIDPEYHTKIFQAFSRLHNRQAYKGSGLGLTMCRKITHILNGSIRLDSNVGKGTTFEVRLPTANVSSTKKSSLMYK